MIKSLSLIVVSMDHIGSTYYNKPRKLAAAERTFLENINLTVRLAQIRGILCTAYNSQSGETDIARLESEGEGLPYWKPNQRKSR